MGCAKDCVHCDAAGAQRQCGALCITSEGVEKYFARGNKKEKKKEGHGMPCRYGKNP